MNFDVINSYIAFNLHRCILGLLNFALTCTEDCWRLEVNSQNCWGRVQKFGSWTIILVTAIDCIEWNFLKLWNMVLIEWQLWLLFYFSFYHALYYLLDFVRDDSAITIDLHGSTFSTQWERNWVPYWNWANPGADDGY